MPRKRMQVNGTRNRATLQIRDIFKLLAIEHTEEAERLASTLLNFLVYMAPGDEIQTPWVTFGKIGDDLLVLRGVSRELMMSHAADTLEGKAIINLPT